MANHRSALKAVRRDARRTRVNADRRSRVRTFMKRLLGMVSQGEQASAADMLPKVQKEVMRAASKGVMHKRTAARRISRLAKKVAVR